MPAVTATRALAAGVRGAWRRPELVGGLYLLNLAWTLAVTWPFLLALSRATALRPYAAPLARGLQVDVLAEIVARRPLLGTAAQAAVGVGVAGWLVLSWFLTAGVLGVLREAPRELTLRRFLALAGAHGLAMARLQLWSALPYAAAIAALAGGVAIAGWAAFRAVNPFVTVAAGAAGALPGLVMLVLTTTAVDVARAQAVLGADRAMGRLLLRAYRLVVARWRATIGVQLGAGLLWLAASAAYLALAWPWPYAATAAFVLLTLLRQALVVARTGVRVATLGANLEVVAEVAVERA
ncbi:MAG TPA: hypothetical protein VGQ83_14725 [Polyangia bacterium]|jgi:hypothetical protein